MCLKIKSADSAVCSVCVRVHMGDILPHSFSFSRERERESSPGGGARCCWLVGGKTAGEVECSENGWVGGLLRLGGGGKGHIPKSSICWWGLFEEMREKIRCGCSYLQAKTNLEAACCQGQVLLRRRRRKKSKRAQKIYSTYSSAARIRSSHTDDAGGESERIYQSFFLPVPEDDASGRASLFSGLYHWSSIERLWRRTSAAKP